MHAMVVCDFDGTVTPVDTTDALLGRFALPEWEDVEKEWLAGRITSRECMERQVAMLRAGPGELDAFIDTFEIAPGFREFVRFCERGDLDLRIVSDGIDYTIRRVLSNHGLADIPVFANHLVVTDGGYELRFPYSGEGCKFGMCKCGVADAGYGETIVIGDSHSDTCVAGRAGTVYALRGRALETYCIEAGISHTVFNDFYDITEDMTHKAVQQRKHA